MKVCVCLCVCVCVCVCVCRDERGRVQRKKYVRCRSVPRRKAEPCKGNRVNVCVSVCV